MLPDSFKKLTLLEYLNLNGCRALIIKSELHIFENMTELRYLNLDGCRKLGELRLPEVASLTKLYLGWTSLKELPANLSQLSKLIYLGIGSKFLTTLPTSLGNLSSLTTLNIQGCKKLESLPDSLEHLNFLRNLYIEHSGVKCLPKSFIHLQNLTIRDTPISEVSFGSRCMLKKLTLSQTKVSKISIGGDCCPVLETLYLSSNKDLRDLETLPTTLKTIRVENCNALKKIGGVRGLKKLKDLQIYKCEELDGLPCFAEFVSLENFNSKGSRKVKKIAGLQELRSLRALSIDLDELPSFAEFTSLQKLELEKCNKLEIIETSERLRSLLQLRISGCAELERLPSLAQLTSLKELDLARCPKLEKIEGLENTRSLERLTISDCPELEALPSLTEITSLIMLELKNCHKLEKIEGLERLRLLERLEVHTRRNAPYIVRLEQCERLELLVVVANQRSAVKPFVSSIQKWPSQVTICTRAECDVGSLKNYFQESSNLSVIDYSNVYSSVGREGRLKLMRPEIPPNANAILICFIIDCVYPDLEIPIVTGFLFNAKLGEGKWVWMGVSTQASCALWSKEDYIGGMVNSERKWVKGGVKVEEAWLVTGEEGRIVEAFHQLFGSEEQRVVKNVVNRVMKEMNKVPLEVAKHPVGLDEAVEEFNTLQSAGSVQIIGVWGMGGSGKTTLAKEIFNTRHSDMQWSSFISDVRDADRKGILLEKQKTLLQDLDAKEACKQIHNLDEGKQILKTRLSRSVSVLIVLDDVDHVDQLDALLPPKEILGHQCLIIVTTRNAHVLQLWGISAIYKMRPLNATHAKQLFCWHAFLQNSPPSELEDLVEMFLNACQGLPLSLKVLGGHLYGRSDKDYWQRTFNKFSQVPHEDITKKLKVSYDALEEQDKKMFLDTACFFIGQRKSAAIAIWDAEWDGLLGWETLFNKCLVEVDKDGLIRMHDHLRDLGREIANGQSPHRLWSPQQAIQIPGQQEAVRVRGMANAIGDNCYQRQVKIIINTEQGERSLAPCSLGLKIFFGDGDFINQEHSEISRELLWLHCKKFEHKNLPSWLSLKKLRILEIFHSRRLEDLWEGEADAPLQLRELVIQKCNSLRGFPRSIGHLKNLKKILVGYDYDQCHTLSGLPEEFCRLQLLEHLEMEWCTNLSSLPSNFGELTNLRHLNLRGCKKLKMLPDSFKKLTLLEYLNLGGCRELIVKSELHIFENMTGLRYLNLNVCRKLGELRLPEVASLTELYLRETRLKELPANIILLTKLTDLVIGSEFLTTLPTSLGNLSSTTLKIQGCKKLESLPDSLEHLSLLRNLYIEYSGVKCLPKSFIHLQNLTIRQTPISEVSFVSGCMLKKLTLSQTKVSKISIGEDCCPVLETLYLSFNKDLRDLETLPTTLKTIDVQNCNVLKKIGGVRGLKKLKDLRINNCKKLEGVPCFAELVSLENFELKGSRKVKKIAGLQELRSLRALSIDLDELPSFAEFTSLQKLELEKCNKLEIIETSERLRSLLQLSISGCAELERLPSLAQLASLKELDLARCPKLEKIEGLENTRSLERLTISDCPELEALPSLTEITSLIMLELKNCHKLEKIEGLERLRLLERLEVRTRRNAPYIVSLEQCERLESLVVVANQRSAVKPFVSSIQKWPRKVIICTRAECDVGSLKNYFQESSNLSVLDYFNVGREGRLKLMRPESPPNANAHLKCFIIDCVYPDLDISIQTDPFFHAKLGGPYFNAKLGEGKWVWMGVFTQDTYDFLSKEDYIAGMDNSKGTWVKELVKVEEAWLVTGEEGRIVEAFHQLFGR